MPSAFWTKKKSKVIDGNSLFYFVRLNEVRKLELDILTEFVHSSPIGASVVSNLYDGLL